MVIVAFWSDCIGKTKQIWFNKLVEPIRRLLLTVLIVSIRLKNGYFAFGLWGYASNMENE